MFCHNCGTQIQPGQQVCGYCGTPLRGLPAVPSRNRVFGHVRTLGILWIVASAFRILPVLGLHWFWPFQNHTDWGYGNFPGPFLGLIGFISGIWALTGLAGLVAGWGLLDRQPWARMLAIVLGCIALIHLPFGTALGIYTLWVLLPPQSEEDYRRIARA